MPPAATCKNVGFVFNVRGGGRIRRVIIIIIIEIDKKGEKVVVKERSIVYNGIINTGGSID